MHAGHDYVLLLKSFQVPFSYAPHDFTDDDAGWECVDMGGAGTN
jgi:hypothetical protein